MDEMQEPLFTTVKLEDFVPADHPLRRVRLLVNDALKQLNGLFNVIYADTGRASIAPEKLLRALLLQVFYSVRSERMLMEQMRYNLLFRWFVGLAIEDAVWDHSVFSKNRDRLLEHEVVEAFFTEVMSLADKRGPAVGRAFLCGRYADSGVGESQELPCEGRLGQRWAAGKRRA
ncbi:transposase [Paraburkholderia bryophila]|uniref:Transposase n=1 Tax=Paraburkholderia bryophila TaxID=420952 RepID=A0A7Y9WD64_9BURK|nr:transposase [Paraburkholderia bryophila]